MGRDHTDQEGPGLTGALHNGYDLSDGSTGLLSHSTWKLHDNAEQRIDYALGYVLIVIRDCVSDDACHATHSSD